VLTLPRSVRIFISSGPTDMRRSIDGLMAIVKEELEGDAYSSNARRCAIRRSNAERAETFGQREGVRRQHPNDGDLLLDGRVGGGRVARVPLDGLIDRVLGKRRRRGDERLESDATVCAHVFVGIALEPRHARREPRLEDGGRDLGRPRRPRLRRRRRG
jgi:transposase